MYKTITFNALEKLSNNNEYIQSLKLDSNPEPLSS